MTSPSTRRAWIEILNNAPIANINEVALHPEGVDRNVIALLKNKAVTTVALHPEGVDRNNDFSTRLTAAEESPSTRRAWIEITLSSASGFLSFVVALHPEGVDRNSGCILLWHASHKVALHPEGVDRNHWIVKTLMLEGNGRPPPGGRG